MGNIHLDEKRGLRERVFESVVADMHTRLSEWRLGGMDDVSLVASLDEQIDKLRYLVQPGAIASALKHAEMALIDAVLQDEKAEEFERDEEISHDP